MDSMAEWYKESRSAFLLLQSVIGVLLVSYPLKKRSRCLLRLIIGTVIGCAFLVLVGNSIYLRGYTPAAIASHAAVPLIVYCLEKAENLTAEIINRMGMRKAPKGVKVEIKGKKVYVDMALGIDYGYNVPETSHKVQEKVKEAIETMMGLEVEDVNIHIASVVLPQNK